MSCKAMNICELFHGSYLNGIMFDLKSGLSWSDVLKDVVF